MDFIHKFDALHGIMAVIIIYLLWDRHLMIKHQRRLQKSLDSIHDTFDALLKGITPTTVRAKPVRPKNGP